MKKSNVISLRLDDKEIEKLNLYSKLYNTDKPSSIIKGLLMTNPYFEILKDVINDLDNKEAKLILLKLDFPNDKELNRILDNKIEYIDQVRTDILRKIDDKLTAIGLVHSLIPNNSICNESPNNFEEDLIDFDTFTESDSYKNCDEDDSIDFDKFPEPEAYKNLTGEELIRKMEEESKEECEKMKYRARLFLDYL